jgi:hypothetical protein
LANRSGHPISRKNANTIAQHQCSRAVRAGRKHTKLVSSETRRYVDLPKLVSNRARD